MTKFYYKNNKNIKCSKFKGINEIEYKNIQ